MDTTSRIKLRPPGRRSFAESMEILRALIVQEIHVKYKRSLLGFLWTFVTPLALAAVYLYVFTRVIPVGSEDYSLFLITGLFPWHFFSAATTAATSSLVANAPLVGKVAFPRILVPLSAIASTLVSFGVAVVLLTVVMAFAGRPVWLGLHWLLAAVVLEVVLCVSVSAVLSVCNVYLRDVEHLTGVALLFAFFATPIVYDVSFVPGRYRLLLYANPFAAVVELFRAALFDLSTPPDGRIVVAGAVITAVSLPVGLRIFAAISPSLPKEL